MIDSGNFLPALLGGNPVRPEGPPAWPFPDEEVLQALRSAYEDGSWGKYHGTYVERLEQRLAEYHQIEFARTCSSGTIAVELALRALKVQADDEVILAAYDYPGNFLSVHAVGAKPVLTDVAGDNWNLNVDHLSAAVEPATRAVIASHLHGGVVPMRELMAFCRPRGLKVIEDAAQAPGAIIQGRKAGTWGDVGVLSFGGSKLLSAGRGGALLTGDADVNQRLRLLTNRGNHICPLSELQAAVLLPQLEKLDHCNAVRSQSVARLSEPLQEIPGIRRLVNHCSETRPAYYKLGLQLDPEAFGISRDLLIAAMCAEGFAVDEGFRAFHVERSPRRFRQGGDLPEASLAHSGMVVLHHPILLTADPEIDQLGLAFRKIYANRARLKQSC